MQENFGVTEVNAAGYQLLLNDLEVKIIRVIKPRKFEVGEARSTHRILEKFKSQIMNKMGEKDS